MTDQYICKWDDGNTKLVDSIMSESSGSIGIIGKFGVGTTSPGYPIEVQTTGSNAGFYLDRTDGATFKCNVTNTQGQIGTTTSHKLNFTTNNLNRMTIGTNGYIGIGDAFPAYPIDHSSGARLTTGGVWTDASSREYKENIKGLTSEEAMEVLEGLNPVTFNYKVDKEDGCVGFIAEDVPELVASKDRKGMSAMDVVAVLTKVVKEQQKRDKEQQKMILEQQKNISELKKNQKIISELKKEIYELKKNLK